MFLNLFNLQKWLSSLNEPTNVKILEKSIKLFNFLNSILFAGSYIEGDNVHSDFAAIDPIRQDILRHLDAHSLGIKLIKDSIYFLDDEEFKRQKSDLFKICFQFLRNFVDGNQANQM